MTFKGQGQGSHTALKQQRFERFLRQHMMMVKGILSRRPDFWQYYLYADLNSGCGYNEEADCEGSPVIACRVARDIGIPIYGLFFERNPEIAEQLEKNLAGFRGPHAHINVFACDHNEKIGQALQSLRSKNRFGLVYHDPNGAEVPTETYTEFSSRLPRVDALMNINATVRKRIIGQSEESRQKYNPDFSVRLDECLSAIPKTHCFVTAPVGGHQWTMAVLTNYKPKGLPSEWHDILTPEGRQALDKAAYTKAENAQKTYGIAAQPQLNF